MDIKQLELFKKVTAELAQCVDDIGGCDHSVGICTCSLYTLLDEAKACIVAEEQKQKRG